MLQFLSFLLTVYTVGAVCPFGFIHYGDSCYAFVAQEMAWDKAQEFCLRRYGAHLAEVKTAGENQFILDYLNNNTHTFYGYDLWLGGTDNTFDKSWRWAVLSNTTMTFTDWSPGQPDGSFQGLERCLELESTYKLKWNDDDCYDHNLFICERPFNPPIPPLPGVGR
ncbi:rheacalcin-1-like [Haliotis asinina]|uniref:rheacalcin-1-like n=1 Tax=Haliotis asinina TaxID=109174 RepID=UPI003531CFFA